MIGRVFVNEIAPDAVALDFSTWPGEILRPETPYGFAYLKTLDALSIRREVVNDTGNRTALLAGDAPTVQKNLRKLRGSIGLIARYGAALDYPGSRQYTRDDIGRSINDILLDLGVMPTDTPFAAIASRITKPFADAANDPKESFYMIPRQLPWWLGEAALGERAARIAAFIDPAASAEEA